MAQKVTLANFLIVVRLGIAGLFLYAGVVKVLHPYLFLKDIESYRLVSYRVAYLTSLYLPWLEIACGLGLVFKVLYTESLLTLSVLVTAFSGFIISAWARGLNISCGCFGGKSSELPNYPWLVTRDFLILAALVVLLEFARRHRLREPAAEAVTGEPVQPVVP